jgi:hypothetical protein
MTESKNPKESMTDREAYNTVSDTVTGVNFRWRDNLFQGVGILVFVLIGALVGFILATPGYGLGVAAIGGFLGLVAGFFVTGIILMIYRAVQHARGKHD